MTVNGMPWQGRRRGSGTETSLAGHQNECAFFVLLCFFFNFFGFFSVHSRKMANIGELPLRSLAEGPHPSSESAKKLKLPLCLRPPNNVAKENFFTVVFVQVVKKSALDVQNLLFFHLLIGLIAVDVTVAFLVAPRIYRCA